MTGPFWWDDDHCTPSPPPCALQMRELLQDTWAEHIAAARLLLVGTSKRTLPLFFGTAGLLAWDERVRRVPVQFARPSLEELGRVFAEVTRAPPTQLPQLPAAAVAVFDGGGVLPARASGLHGESEAAAVAATATTDSGPAPSPAAAPAATAATPCTGGTVKVVDEQGVEGPGGATATGAGRRKKKRRGQRKDKTARQLAAAAAVVAATATASAGTVHGRQAFGSDLDSGGEEEAEVGGAARPPRAPIATSDTSVARALRCACDATCRWVVVEPVTSLS